MPDVNVYAAAWQDHPGLKAVGRYTQITMKSQSQCSHTGVTAVRVCYPKDFCLEHAKVHAAACASTVGSVTAIWACRGGSVRAGNPAIGIQFSAAIAAAKMRYQQLPAVRGSFISVLPWEGSRASEPHAAGGCYVAPLGVKLPLVHIWQWCFRSRCDPSSSCGAILVRRCVLPCKRRA